MPAFIILIVAVLVMSLSLIFDDTPTKTELRKQEQVFNVLKRKGRIPKEITFDTYSKLSKEERAAIIK